MKTCEITTFDNSGIDIYRVTVELSVLSGLPSFSISGLADKSIQESKDRVLSVLKSLNISRPIGKIIINLSPAVFKKGGTYYDLAILMAFISYRYQKSFENFIVIGELSLGGKILSTTSMILGAALAYETNRNVICSYDDLEHALLLLPRERIFAFKHVKDLVKVFCNNEKYNFPEVKLLNKNHINKSKNKIISTFCSESQEYLLTLSLTGRHHMLVIGAPGSGKTTMMNLMKEILSPLSLSDTVDVLKVYECANIKRENIYSVPFRSPHTSSSLISLTGGGHGQKPGEMSLAHRGILFLDEVSEFNMTFLNSMRTPLEEKLIHISRANYNVTYPCDFLLLMASNPCGCGLKLENNCRCRGQRSYLDRIPMPIMDRTDIIFYLYRSFGIPKLRELNISQMQNKIQDAQEKARKRFGCLNGQVSDTKLLASNFIHMDAKNWSHKYCVKNNLSLRRYACILRLACTVADLDNKDVVTIKEVSQVVIFSKFI